MKPNHEFLPPALGGAEARFEANPTGGVRSAERDPSDGREGSEALRRIAAVEQALRKLPELRCPPRLIAAAEADATRPATLADAPAGLVNRSRVLLALAASIALVWFGLPRPATSSDPVITTTLEADEAKLALAELGEAFRFRAEAVKRKVYDRGVAKPVRTVVCAMTESELGDWGAKAANLLGRSEASSRDAI